MVFFQMVHNEKLLIRSGVKYRTFSESPTWRDLFPLCSYKKWETAVYCRKIVAYRVKIVKCLVHIISENLLKAISLMFETETLTLFSSEIEVGSHAPLPPTHPVITPLLFCLFLKLSKVFSVFLRKNTLIRKAFQLQERKSFIDLNPLIANPTKWSNTLK